MNYTKGEFTLNSLILVYYNLVKKESAKSCNIDLSFGGSVVINFAS